MSTNLIIPPKAAGGSGGLQSATTAAIFAAIRQNTMTALGDSNTLGQLGWASSLCNVVALRSKGLVRLVRNGGISGQTSPQIAARSQQDSLAYDPGMLLLMTGTNDGAGQYQTSIPQIVAVHRARGVPVFVCTVYPDAVSGTGPSLAKNQWIRNYVATLGDPGVVLADVNSVLDDGTGKWLNAADHTDNLHITPAATRRAADVVLAAMATVLYPVGFPKTLPGDTYNAIPNGTFDQGTATNGLASGAVLQNFSGTLATASIVAPVTADNLVGNWQKLTIPAGAAGEYQVQMAAGALTKWAGKRAVFALRVQTTGYDTTGQTSQYWSATVTENKDVAGTTLGLDNVFIANDAADGYLYFEGVLTGLAGTGMFKVKFNNPAASAGPVTIQFGDVQAYVKQEDGLPFIQPQKYRSAQFVGSITVTADDQIVDLDCTGAQITVNLPSVASSKGLDKVFYRVDATASRAPIFTPAGSDKINGAASLTTALANQYGFLRLTPFGNTWRITGQG